MTSWPVATAAAATLAIGLVSQSTVGQAGQKLVADDVDAVEAAYVADQHGMTLDEAASFIRLEERATTLAEDLGVDYSQDYAGAWVVWHPEPGIIFGTVASEGSSEFTRRVEAEGFQVQLMNSALHQLDAAMDDLNRRFELGRAESAAAHDMDAFVDVPSSAIRIRVEQGSPLLDAVQRWASDQPVTVQISTVAEELGGVGDACTSTDCDPPLRGGPQVESSTGNLCSFGFVMAQDGDRYASTASHCSGSPWSHDNHSVGPTFWTHDGGSVDAKAIEINNSGYWEPTNMIRRPSDHTFRITLEIENPGLSLIGNTICRVGYRNGGGEYCGELATYNASKYGNTHQGKVNQALACPGDSGGPWFNPSSSRAYGIHMGSDDDDACTSGEASYFTWVAYFESMSGLHIRLNP